MLEGLEISEVALSDVLKDNESRRIDSEYFKKIHLRLLDNEFSKSHEILCDIAAVKGGKRLPKGDSFCESEIPYIRAEDVKNTFVDYQNSPRISEKTFAKIKSYQTKKNDVLLTIVGNSIGDVGFVPFDLKKCNLTENCVRIKTNKVKPHFLFSYFLSKYGQLQIEREKVGTAQPKLAIERIRKFKILNVPKNIQDEIEKIILSSNQKLDNSKSLYSEAEELLLVHLKLKNWIPQNKSTTNKKLSEVNAAGRFDAEFYQPKYDDLFDKLSKLNTKTLGELASFKKSIEPGSELYQDEGVPFVRVSDLNKFGISETKLHLPANLFDLKKLRPRQNTILFSKDGTIGIAYKCEENLDIITSSALLHLSVKTKDCLPDYLTLVLNSKVVQMQAERDSNGANIVHWKPDDIKKVVIPILPEDIQSQIAKKVQESFRLRAESKRLLEQAKQMVEDAIEHGENTSNIIEYEGHKHNLSLQQAAEVQADFRTKKN